jgi:hypothetical protein
VIASVFIGVLILPRAWGLLKSVIDVLLESAPPGMHVDEIQAAICRVPGVRSARDLHVWTITSGFVALSAHVLANDRPSEDVLHDVQTLVRDRFGVEHATLQVESVDHADTVPAAPWTRDVWWSAPPAERDPSQSGDRESSRTRALCGCRRDTRCRGSGPVTWREPSS